MPSLPSTVRPFRTLSLGEGPAVVLLHGFAMQPETYLPLARRLAGRVRVIIPAIFETPDRWRYLPALHSLAATIDQLGPEPVTLVGHSFGGGLELGYAATYPDRVEECVFADTLGVNDRFRLAGEALRHPLGLRHMATRPAMSAFARSWLTHPLKLVAAGWWGFISERGPDIERIAAASFPRHVMWASRDSLLSRASGEQFARRLGATFTVADEPHVDHDWMFERPELFAEQLEGLGLRALCSGPRLPAWEPGQDAWRDRPP